jgi:hypothetical protein
VWLTVQGAVDWLTGQGRAVTVVREGQLAGVLRVPYGKSQAGHPWRANLGVLWDGDRRRYLAWYSLLPDGWSVGWSRDVEIPAAEIPDGVDPGDYALAAVVRQIHRTRGDGTGPKCLFRVTSAGWASGEEACVVANRARPRQAARVQRHAEPAAAPDRGGTKASRGSRSPRRRGR